jgi:peptidoglycan lytic transglycosylase
MQSMMIVAVLGAVLAAAPDEAPVKSYARAVEAWRAGRYGEARRGFLLAAAGGVQTRDWATLYAGLSALRGGRPGEAARILRGLRDGPRARRARHSEADALWDLGRKREAAALYAQPGDGDAGVALYRSGQLRRLLVEEPDHPLCSKVHLKLGPAERIQRARNLIERRHWQRAAQEMDALPGAEARYWAGMARYRTRHDYAKAADLLLEASRGLSGELAADALFHSARALSRADQDDLAIARYREVVRRFPKAPDAAEAAFLVGWLDYNRGRFQDALAPLGDAERVYRDSKQARPAGWFLGWSRFLLGGFTDALADLDRLSRGADGELDLGKLAYWRGRCLERLGRKADAEAAWRDVQTRFPLSWYALLARRRVAVDVPPADAREPEIDPAVAGDKVVARVDELLEVGLGEDAAAELRDAEAALLKRHGERAIGVLIDRYRRAGDWKRVYLLGAAHGVPSASFPLAYRDLVDRYGPPGGNPEFYLLAIMRKESAFDPRDASYADAQGLLQMIPPTSRRVATRVGMTYKDGILYEPEANVRLGAWYIGRLFKKFGAQVPLGAGAYNAGPGPMMRWCDKNGGRPLDEFVELVPFEQTREYIKKVTANYARYLHIYRQTLAELPEVPDCKYAVDDINY